MSALADQLKAKMPDASAEARLYVTASDLLRLLGPNEASQRLAAFVAGRPDLCRAMARRYLELLASDMAGTELKDGPLSPVPNEGQKSSAHPSPPSDGGAKDAPRNAPTLASAAVATTSVSEARSSLPERAMSPIPPHAPNSSDVARRASPLPPLNDRHIRGTPSEEGPVKPRSQEPFMPSPSSDPITTGGPTVRRTYVPIPARLPVVNPPRRYVHSVMAAPLIKSMWDTFKVRDGRPIGNLCLSEAKSLRGVNEREARILAVVIEKAGAGDMSDPFKPLRQLVSEDVLRDAIATNREKSDAR